MIVALALAAHAAPVLVEPTLAPLARCTETADAEAGIDGTPTASTLGENLERVAVIVGVPCHRSPAIPSLAYSSRDATRMADRLEQEGYGVLRLTTVVDRAQFDAALDAAERALAPGGSVLVYFSGHGVLREDGGVLRRYLVFSDTNLEAVERTAWPVRALDDRVSRMPADSRIVVQDTCFAADASEGSKSISLPTGSGRAKGLTVPEGTTALRQGDVRLYASRFYEQALESVDHRGSVYTHHLLGALDDLDADLDGDGCVGALEAHRQAQERTEAERGGFQVPQLHAGQIENLTLGCSPAEPQHAVIAAPPSDDWVVELRSDGEVLRDAGSVAPGRYSLAVRRWVTEPTGELAVRDLLDTRIGLQAGEWLDVAHEVERRAPEATAYVGLTVAPLGSLPPLAGTLGGWWASAARGNGRLVLGAVGSWTPGPGTWTDPRLGFRGGTAEAQLGWWADSPLGRQSAHLTIGPTLAAGTLWRTPYTLDDPTPLPTRLGWSASPTVHAHLALGPLVVGLDLGARITGITDDDGNRPQLAPLSRISVGPRL